MRVNEIRELSDEEIEGKIVDARKEIVKLRFELASSKHVTVVLNPAPARPVPQHLFSKIDYFIPNETDSKLLTGIEVSDLASAEKAAQKFITFGAKNVIVTLGEKGALLVNAQGSTHIPSRKVKAVDSTAAGDAFIAGLANALVRGFSQVEAVRYACAACKTSPCWKWRT